MKDRQKLYILCNSARIKHIQTRSNTNFKQNQIQTISNQTLFKSNKIK